MGLEVDGHTAADGLDVGEPANPLDSVGILIDAAAEAL